MNVITLTLNPALDKSAKVDGLIASQKLKCHDIHFQPGGGGVNVSRMLNRLGVKSTCIFPAGGDKGFLFNQLLLKEDVEPTSIPIRGWTRENFSVVDVKTNLQYRFGMPGHDLLDTELELIKATIDKIINKEDILVISGSLPENVPKDFYAKLIQHFSRENIKVVIDTSGRALIEALKENVFLIKPNQRELAQMAKKDFLSKSEQEDFAMNLIKNEKAEYVVVSLGARGAFLASKDGVFYQSTPSVSVKSTIGAGDSMVAGLIYGVLHNFSAQDILKWGVACGVATTMSEETSLASESNVSKVLDMIAY